jgi:hypothetical protein
MQSKLQRATEKSNAPLGRATILNSIAAPIFTFYATYFMPSQHHTKAWDRIIMMFIWTGRLQASRRLSSQIARQDIVEYKRKRGVGLRTVERLLQDDTGAKVIRWTILPPYTPVSIVGTVLLATTKAPRVGQQYTPTTIGPVHTLTANDSTWNTGAQVAGRWLAHHMLPSQTLRDMKVRLISMLHRHMAFTWRTKTQVTWTLAAELESQIHTVHKRLALEFPPAALAFMPHFIWTNNPWFTVNEHNLYRPPHCWPSP